MDAVSIFWIIYGAGAIIALFTSVVRAELDDWGVYDEGWWIFIIVVATIFWPLAGIVFPAYLFGKYLRDKPESPKDAARDALSK